MKQIVSLLVILCLFSSCKDEVVKKPDHLIEKGTMMDIIYDLSILEAIKNSGGSTLENYKTNPKEYIYKKYKIDSTQFAQNNIYYSANYEEYKDMFNQVAKRMEDKKVISDSLSKIQIKRDSIKGIKKENKPPVKNTEAGSVI